MQSYKKLDFSRRSNEGADQCFSIHGFCETRIIKWCSKYLVFQGENWFFINLSFHENIFCTLALFQNSALQCDTIPELLFTVFNAENHLSLTKWSTNTNTKWSLLSLSKCFERGAGASASLHSQQSVCLGLGSSCLL